MKRIPVIVVALLLLALLILLALERAGREPAEAEIPLQEAFDTKVVYTTEMEADTVPLVADCRQRGGMFNPCGSVCAPDESICAEVCAYTCDGIPEEQSGTGVARNRSVEESAGNPAGTSPAPGVDTGGWSTRTLQGYGVALAYPASDWSVDMDTSFAQSPKLNVYLKPPGVPVDMPLDHFANITHFSIYPRGIPTEGLFGETRPLDIPSPFPVSAESRLYVLEDGTPYAAYVKPSRTPREWNDSGFIWMRVRVPDLQTRCIRDGNTVSEAECDPLTRDDQILRTGSVDPESWRVEKAILRTVHLGDPGGRGEATERGDSAAVGENQAADMVSIQRPQPLDTVTNPLTVSGRARGPWYFEGSFPLVLTDWDGLIIAETQARAQGEWTVEGFVPFEATLHFQSPYQDGDPEYMRRGTLILQRANPSGRPENASALEIPVSFAGS